MNFPQLLESKYLEWRQSEGVKKNETEFAQWLGFQKSTLSTWWRGKSTPNDERILRKLAKKLGPEVYDSLGLARPDPLLMIVNDNWNLASEELQRSIVSQLQKGLFQNDAKRVPKTRKKRTDK